MTMFRRGECPLLFLRFADYDALQYTSISLTLSRLGKKKSIMKQMML
jgi:hypothetical protein